MKKPLEAEWRHAKQRIWALLARGDADRSAGAAFRESRAIYAAFPNRLRSFRVLDPACGSGNFLSCALFALSAIEREVLRDAEEFGLPPSGPEVGPHQCLGIEIHPEAAALARLTLWIAAIQSTRRNPHGGRRDRLPELPRRIVYRDALLDRDGRPAEWPEAEAIVGNPPFLGVRQMRRRLGDDYVEALFRAYTGKVSRESDLVCYWFAKAREQMAVRRAERAGLVATSSIRGGANRKVLDSIEDEFRIYEAWLDEPWTSQGAAIRVSIVCFARRDDPFVGEPRLDGRAVPGVHANLTERFAARAVARLAENRNVAFMGDTKGGPFEIPGDVAREWLFGARNPHGRPDSDVLRPWWNGLYVTRRPRDMWIVDFGWEMDEHEVALYLRPFDHVVRCVRSARLRNARPTYRTFWWRHAEPRPGMWDAIGSRPHYIATPRVSRHRVFVRVPRIVCPDSALVVVARDDDVTFGILQSRFHTIWALHTGTSLEDRPRYTPTTTFETFPFPEGITPDRDLGAFTADERARRIANAARRLDRLRRDWLHPADLVVVVPEVVPGYPDRILPRDDRAAEKLRRRTMTRLYNEMPAWLKEAHRALDDAVAAAYGWPADLEDHQILARLRELNRSRAGTANHQPPG